MSTPSIMKRKDTKKKVVFCSSVTMPSAGCGDWPCGTGIAGSSSSGEETEEENVKGATAIGHHREDGQEGDEVIEEEEEEEEVVQKEEVEEEEACSHSKSRNGILMREPPARRPHPHGCTS